MATLGQLLRRRVSYYPFSERSYRGSYPLGSARRAFFGSTNRLSPWLPAIQKSLLFSPKTSLPLYLYEDRRLYHPEGVNRRARSLTESYPQIVERRPWRPVGPHYPKVDPRGVPQKLVPSRTDPSGWTYIADKPSVLEKWRLGHEDPWKVIICLKRKIRKEVMHAFGYAGGRGYKTPIFTKESLVRCF